MNFWASFPFVTDKITHFLIPLSTDAKPLKWNKYSIFRAEDILEHKI